MGLYKHEQVRSVFLKKVLIITYSFPPLNSIASRRYGEFSEYLNNDEWETHILTTNSTGPLPVNLPEENILRVGSNIQKGGAIIKYSGEKTIKQKLLTAKRQNGFNSRLVDRTYFSWFKKISQSNIEILKHEEFDIIIASFGPGSALFLGDYLSRKLKVPWIADFRDLGALHREKEFKKNIIFKLIDNILERKILKKASAIITVSDGLKEELLRVYRKPVFTIYNGWKRSGEIKVDNNGYTTKPYIYYAGQFYEHRLKGLFLLIKTLRDTEMNLKIRSLGPDEMNTKIMNYVEKMNLTERVELLPPADPDIVKSESIQASINLVLEDLDKTHVWKKGVLTGKFLSLLIEEPSILAIARDDSEIGKILINTGKGRLCSTEEQIENYLTNEFLEEKSINYDEIELYSKKNQSKNLLKLLDRYCEKNYEE